MSGGVAFVYDKSHSFLNKCNVGSVDLDPVQTEEDAKTLKALIVEFHEKTGSRVAEKIITKWSKSVKRFVKVFPKEFKRVLEEAAAVKKEENYQVDGQSDYKEDILQELPSSTMLQVMREVSSQRTVSPEKNSVQPVESSSSSCENSNDEMFSGVQEKVLDALLAETMDIENILVTPMPKKVSKPALDKTRGFIKYPRQTNAGSALHGLRGSILPRNNWKEALIQLLQTNNFPEFTGRVCPAPCEGACCLAISEPAVTIKNIECSIIEFAFEKGWVKPEPPAFRTGKRIAVVGSGPAGLAAAAQLNKVGHTVIVYERSSNVGGLLEFGIPTMKLSKQIIDRRIRLMEAEGIKFVKNIEVGKDVPAKLLLMENDVVLVAVGATKPRDLTIPGRNLKGIHFAMEFLSTWQSHQRGFEVDYKPLHAQNRNVIIIGGGDTATDCLGTCLRQGAKSVVMFEIMPRPPNSRASNNPWPEWPLIFRVEYGHEEYKVKYDSDPRIYCISTKDFVGDESGHVSGVRTVQVKWNRTEDGRAFLEEIENSEKIFHADMVLLAMGFLGPESTVIDQLKLEQDARSNIQTADGKYSTSLSKVFAAGDCRRGQSLVVWAIHEGRQAAREIDVFLMGKTSLAGPGGMVAAPLK
ncbi:amyloplastic,Glutamate synthase [NADH] [Trichinella spiralis]|uniref:Amyloplastic,Glutamate synthase [NADH] n=1 Tax=Trichinella spiralis TaxID=6334 RepID=A0ABR3KNU0_TRISP